MRRKITVKMSSFLNQYSFVWMSAAVLLALFIGLRLRRISWKITLGIIVPVAAVLLVGYFALRPGASDVESFTDAAATLANGRPTFLEFFSNY